MLVVSVTTYRDIDEEESMREEHGYSAEAVQVGRLIAPLCDYAQCIFQERNNDEEAA